MEERRGNMPKDRFKSLEERVNQICRSPEEDHSLVTDLWEYLLLVKSNYKFLCDAVVELQEASYINDNLRQVTSSSHLRRCAQLAESSKRLFG